MGSASKFIMLLSTPFPFLCSRPSTLRLARYARVSIACFSSSGHHSRLSSNSRPRLASPIKVSEQIHTQTSSIRGDYADESVGFSSYRVSHPWLEWSKLVENLMDRGYFDCQSSSLENSNKDEFSVFEDLPEEFVRAASACLSFARDKPDILGSLSRKDIEVIVENGSPFLFKNSLESARRMRSFLGRSGSDDLESRKVIGTGRETNGIYLLGESSHWKEPVDKKSFVSQSVSPVMLWHNQLGHFSFRSLKSQFPTLFESVEM